MEPNPTLERWIHYAGRTTLLALGWILLAGPAPESWILGIPSVLLATWASLRLAPPRRRGLSPRGLMAFLPYFLWQSVRGGIDVAGRILHPRMPIAPGFQIYRTRLSKPAARVLFLDSISLLPGSLSADLDGDRLRIHAIDADSSLAPELAALERRIAALFGERLPDPTHG
ncbi:Na+/H+ antiporter subunit E [Imhoffiella purpurea]|uniref:Putative Na(+) H(+) antiporter subunit E n=1 Tax=Imhoffiella purpurea TaxID=1249627 RepID=W9V9Z4_9GAMM|nr:Na+/H+ antiporter subunit E [Imhoffiella purpurea]EXJ13731.1 putative Na(+) H(+) antiporter subunit E [Imhoffiella purpurea]